MESVVSVIIPVYNAERFLHKCIDSVIYQTYKSIQVILVDDGSSDNSLAICEDYRKKDERIILLSQKNQGPSVARNNGLRVATGDYVMFLDSDDFWIYRDGLEKILAHPLCKNEDFVYLEFNRCRFIPSKNVFYDFPRYPKSLLKCSKTDSVIVELVKKGIFPVSACTKLVNRSFLIKNKIEFFPDIYAEDVLWFMDVLKYAESGIAYYNYYLYGNTTEITSSRSKNISSKKIDDVLYIIDTKSKEIIDSGINDEIKDALLSSLAYRYVILCGMYYSKSRALGEGYKHKLTMYGWLLKYDLHPKVKTFNKLRKMVGIKGSSMLLVYYLNHKDVIKRILSFIKKE